MKPFPVIRSLVFALLSLPTLSLVQANEVVPLDSGRVVLQSSERVELVRTSATPSKIEIHVPVEMSHRVCKEYGQVPRTGPNASRCGVDRIVRRVCRHIPGRCRIDSQTGREICLPPSRHCFNEVIEQPRVCTWLETVCVRTGLETHTATRKALLRFKNMKALNAGESESFLLTARQRNTDATEAVFSLEALKTLQPVKIKERDGIFTGFKDVITVKGE